MTDGAVFPNCRECGEVFPKRCRCVVKATKAPLLFDEEERWEARVKLVERRAEIAQAVLAGKYDDEIMGRGRFP